MKRARHHIFSFYHPVVIFLYFCAVIGCTLSTLEPRFIALSFCASTLYVIYLRGSRAWLKSLVITAPLFFVVVVINPLFGRLGETVLFSVGKNTITYEALLYGICSGGMLVSMLHWFMCYQEVMTSSKFLALFGSVLPTTAMTLSMVLRFIPLLVQRASQIQLAQAQLVGGRVRGFKAKTRSVARSATVLMSWSMEGSIETADSMRAREYGTGRRTHATHEGFSSRDVLALSTIVLLCVGNMLYLFRVVNTFAFYPLFAPPAVSPLMFGAYGVLLLLPLLLEGGEQLLWRFSR